MLLYALMPTYITRPVTYGLVFSIRHKRLCYYIYEPHVVYITRPVVRTGLFSAQDITIYVTHTYLANMV